MKVSLVTGARSVALVLLLAVGSAAAAKEKRVEVTVERDGRYAVDSFILGAIELVGYLADLKETDGIEAAVLVPNGQGDEESRRKFADAARKAGVKAYVEEKRTLREL
jgi:hypothetical protein